MSSLHDFLVERAKFPFPPLDEHLSSSTTNISTLDVGLLETKWKAKLAVRDDTLVQKLCHALKDILGDAPLGEGAENYLLASFSPRIQVDERGGKDGDWSTNSSEVRTRKLLDKFFVAARKCLWEYDRSGFQTIEEHKAERGASKIDYVALNVLLSIPPRGFQLKWVQRQPLVPKILSKAAIYLGLRKTEWLFLTCFNYWIVCRLVSDDDNPFLAYSPAISIEESSEPFRAFLGAILSVVKGVRVEPSAYNPNITLDTMKEGQDDGPLHEHNIDDGSEYQGRSGRGANTPPKTRSRDPNSRGNIECELLVTSSSPKSPENLQVWTRLHSMSDNSFVIPRCGNDKLRLWFTRFIASGSTGSVWQCRFDTSYDSFAAKIVEVLRPSDTENRQRLRNEFKIYLILDEAYQSGRLRYASLRAAMGHLRVVTWTFSSLIYATAF